MGTALAAPAASGEATTKIDREREIREAAQTMIAARNKWQKGNDNFFPDWLENAFSAGLNVILNGDVPASCVKLHAACVRMADEWALIVSEGEGIDQNGIPGKSFWAKVEAVENLLKQSEKVKNRALASVKQLWEEFKNDPRRVNYIAKMYGWMDKSGEEPVWRGPFFRNGDVSEELVRKELEEPGSVVPAGYHPADEEERNTKKLIQDSTSALARIRGHLKAQGRLSGESVQDPASVEELIKQGQLASVIARVKGISESEVYQIANNLGLKVMTREEIFANATPAKEAADDHIYRNSMLGLDENGIPDARLADGDFDADADADLNSDLNSDLVAPHSSAEDGIDGTDGESEFDSASDSDESPDELLSRLFEQNPEIDTPKAMQALKAAGVTLSPVAVGKKLAAMKRG